MSQNIILDTNVLLHDPEAALNFPGDNVIIPIEVIEEIDRLKHEVGGPGRNSRLAAQNLDDLRQRGSLGTGVTLENGATLRVVQTDRRNGDARAGTAVLRIARALLERKETAVIVSKNVNLRIKADALGVSAQDYEDSDSSRDKLYAGWREYETDNTAVKTLKEGRGIRPTSVELNPFEYFLIRDEANPKHACAARADAQGKAIWPLLNTTRSLCGIRGLNLQQTFTIDALLDDSIRLVTLAGKAGTGKTLLAMAAGLQQLFGDRKFQKLTVFRPTIAVSRDMGFLPGDIDDKMKPWMQPVHDAIDLVRHEDKKQPVRLLPSDVRNCEEISIEPLTYIRGRSIPNQFIIIDEAQNLTPLEAKTAITRVGQGSKIVVTGDPQQIDNPYVDRHSNGLVALIERFRESSLAAHITMIQGERSELAETAANLL